MSIEVARGQSAKSLELRAATSLAELWRTQGRPDEARALLEPICRWFDEGAETADLRRACDAQPALILTGAERSRCPRWVAVQRSRMSASTGCGHAVALGY